MSLLEILISIFVLLIGLLGVAAVIPAGRVEMVEAGKADRAAACARAALHEARTRGFLDPRNWLVHRGGAGGNFEPVVVVREGRRVAPCSTIVIDPLFISSNPGKEHITECVPYGLRFRKMAMQILNSNGNAIRVTLAPFSYSDNGSEIHRPELARRVFGGRDDLLFPVPADPAERPRELTLVDLAGNGSATATVPWPVRPADNVAGYGAASVPLFAQNQGDYSWLLVVVPRPAEILPLDYDGDGTLPIDKNGDNVADDPDEPWSFDIDGSVQYEVSAVVFYKRDLVCPAELKEVQESQEPPSERVFKVEFQGGGWSGGDVTLVAYWPAPPPPPPLSYLNLAEDDWLLVAHAGGGALATPFAWYRVVSVGELTKSYGADARWATLAGPDWRFSGYNASVGFHFNRVIAVHTATFNAGDLY